MDSSITYSQDEPDSSRWLPKLGAVLLVISIALLVAAGPRDWLMITAIVIGSLAIGTFAPEILNLLLGSGSLKWSKLVFFTTSVIAFASTVFVNGSMLVSVYERPKSSKSIALSASGLQLPVETYAPIIFISVLVVLALLMIPLLLWRMYPKICDVKTNHGQPSTTSDCRKRVMRVLVLVVAIPVVLGTIGSLGATAILQNTYVEVFSLATVDRFLLSGIAIGCFGLSLLVTVGVATNLKFHKLQAERG